MKLEFTIKKNYKEAYAGMREVIAAFAQVAGIESRLLNAKYNGGKLIFQMFVEGKIANIKENIYLQNTLDYTVDEEAVVLA